MKMEELGAKQYLMACIEFAMLWACMAGMDIAMVHGWIALVG